MFPSVILAKILGKKIIISAIGLASHSSSSNSSYSCFNKIISKISFLIERVMFLLSDIILIESPTVMNFLGLTRYSEKVYSKCARYIDTKSFTIKKEITKRENLVGYIGRISPEKGILDLINSALIILKIHGRISFLVGGYGILYEKLEEEIMKRGLSDKIRMVGWIPHAQVPEYLNELKLLVLPSYSEGLPTIILEAMACGAIVLASPVGGIPDIIRDGETGFILEDRSPDYIAKKILKILSRSDLEQIARNARRIIEVEYSYESAVKRFKEMLKL
ncbi:MAG: glycosyltransferase family 4 protein [Candidatus Jordarchaeaceae archaeon]